MTRSTFVVRTSVPRGVSIRTVGGVDFAGDSILCVNVHDSNLRKVADVLRRVAVQIETHAAELDE